jgi:hypothetical protein
MVCNRSHRVAADLAMADFTHSFARLQEEVWVSCRPDLEWPHRVVAGVHAAVRFAAADTAAAIVLACPPAGSGAAPDHRRQTIRWLADELQHQVPRERRLDADAREAHVGRIVTMLSGHLRTERTDLLLGLATEAAFLTLLPYLGFEEAKRWAEAGPKADAGYRRRRV